MPGIRSRKLVGHMASMISKRRVNRKWGWAVKSFKPVPSDSLPPARLRPLKV